MFAFYSDNTWFLSVFRNLWFSDSLETPSLAIRRKQWHPTPVLLPGKSHGWRSLVGCSPWGCEEWDMTEQLHFHFSLSCIEKGNGNPLQCSCLENPRDGGAWWAAVYGVAQSQTRLKWLSSSSSISLAIIILTIEEIKEIYNKEKWLTQHSTTELEQQPGSPGPFS